ncbi:MAG: sulfatase-like hydrolase/transferase [Phycisphaeraceae bacterium]|nr:sulfatase-like hydrolase/transferase [Phycisphaeraceae bacterium]
MSAHRNLLLIVARGMRSDALADEQAWPLPTPRMLALAQRGLRLAATSACPADPGGRVSLITGLHARQHGLLYDRSATQLARPRPGQTPLTRPLADSLPSRLRAGGFHVVGVGQIDLFRGALHKAVAVADLDQLNPPHCEYFKAMLDAGIGPAIVEQRKSRLRTGPFEPTRLLLDIEQDIDGYIGDAALKAIDSLPTDKPWALIVVFSGPGNDLPPPATFENAVDIKQLGGKFAPASLATLDALAEPAYPRVMLQRLEPYFVQRIRADYLGRVALLDQIVGKLNAAIDNRPDRSRTWTVLGSDHGYLLGEHGLIGRRSFLSGATTTPLIIAAPTFPQEQQLVPQEVESGLYSTVDFAPTCASLTGCDLSTETAGRSLLPLLHGQKVLPEHPGDSALSEFNDRLMLETERYKIIFERHHRQCIGLYDLLNDPQERRNIKMNEQGQNVLDQLRWRVADALLPLRAWAA